MSQIYLYLNSTYKIIFFLYMNPELLFYKTKSIKSDIGLAFVGEVFINQKFNTYYRYYRSILIM